MHPSHHRLGVEVFIPEENNKNIPFCPHGKTMKILKFRRVRVIEYIGTLEACMFANIVLL